MNDRSDVTLDASTTAIDATAAMPQRPRIVVGYAALSFVGEPFQHDVFVSYAHAERETDKTLIRDWSQKLADRLRTLLASALNPTVSDGSKNSICFSTTARSTSATT